MRILSIQSHVAVGHVGNAAAVLPLQLLGHEVWPVHTVQFSNHTGHDSFTGDVLAPEHVRQVLGGIAGRGLYKRCDGLLSGYLGAAALGEAVLEAAQAIKAANPAALYLCDPVMGDRGTGFYVKPEIVGFFAERALALADIVTPNLFELGALTERQPADEAAVVAAARQVLERGPRLVLVTSVSFTPAPEEIAMLAVSAEAAWRVAAPYRTLGPTISGAGDLTAALFLGHSLAGAAPPEALGRTAWAVDAVIEATASHWARSAQCPEDGELALIEAREALTAGTAERPVPPALPVSRVG